MGNALDDILKEKREFNSLTESRAFYYTIYMYIAELMSQRWNMLIEMEENKG